MRVSGTIKENSSHVYQPAGLQHSRSQIWYSNVQFQFNAIPSIRRIELSLALPSFHTFKSVIEQLVLQNNYITGDVWALFGCKLTSSKFKEQNTHNANAKRIVMPIMVLVFIFCNVQLPSGGAQESVSVVLFNVEMLNVVPRIFSQPCHGDTQKHCIFWPSVVLLVRWKLMSSLKMLQMRMWFVR